MMKNIYLILSILLTGIICYIIGTYMGGARASYRTTLYLTEMKAIDASFALSKSAIYYEALNSGKTQEVINMLYVSIKNGLEIKDDYSEWKLSDATLKSIEENQQKAKDILKKYPKPKSLNCD